MESNNKTGKTKVSPVQDHYKFFYDEVTKRKIERHLSDINDTISDEDILNVITDITSGNPINVNSGNDTIPNNSVDEEVTQMPTSWNVIE